MYVDLEDGDFNVIGHAGHVVDEDGADGDGCFALGGGGTYLIS